MNRILTFLILCILFFDISAQEIPSNSIAIEKGEVDTILLIDSIAVLLEISDSIKGLGGDYSKALEIDNQMLILTSKLYGEKHEEYIKLLGEISIDYRMLAEYDTALALSLECYEMIINILGKEHTEYPRTLNRLAAVYYLIGFSD